MSWKNRIVGNGEEKPDQLLANPKNFRIHPQAQQEALEGVLNEVGWVQNIIVNRRTGFVVDGHMRVQAALRAGAETVPVVYVDLTEREEALVLATLDPMAAMAGIDKEQLDQLLHEVETSSAGIQEMLAALAEQEGSYFQAGEQEGTGGDGEGDVPGEAAELVLSGPRGRFTAGVIEEIREVAQGAGLSVGEVV